MYIQDQAMYSRPVDTRRAFVQATKSLWLILTALATAGREQHLEVVLAVPPPFELVEHVVGKGSEALRAAAHTT